ncbi:helix-turn-helix domain-containing protein [Pseudomonas sp. GD04087]|uniref:transcriptional regulator n=1 Tax=unclassified Pseudomonas TaxID=196821 RepID=UPI002447F223|nr:MULTISPECIES: YdaS family helix-turn-helix protein [unclassified Pseudomonas]MDH0291419.1 helix-turn-helix domain-containing protein [Pseudomonas sp. GD04087]MDH1051731.1 helix-turn-helix domain-containing protein [Pseudomonas sp. GD03903]MDH2001735.1 helix-turn-helix domain-containing protein [Pseudomonas sp. GD03691]
MDLPTYVQGLPRGGKKRLAIFLGVAPSYLSRLISGDRSITAERAIKVEQATGGAVTRFELRPDINWVGLPAGSVAPDLEQIVAAPSGMVQCVASAVQASSAGGAA